MEEELLNFGFKINEASIIKVIGVGGGGNNAVNHMYRMGIRGADFMICNTDAQALSNSPVPLKLQLGVTLTEGRGAGSKPEQGEQAAIENLADVRKILEENTRLVFVTACLGGGTGTGAAPVIANLARELDILTIAVVTIPSRAEGKRRYNQAVEGVTKLRSYVDSILVVDNQKLHTNYGNLPASKAFMKADDVLANAVKGMVEIITLPGNINIDFADVYTVMVDSGVFMMGTGYSEGNDRAINAVREAIDSPLVDCNDIKGAKDILLNIISGEDEITIGEIGDIIEYLQDRACSEANIIWGNGTDLALGKKIRVTIIAAGFNVGYGNILYEEDEKETFLLDEENQLNERIETKVREVNALNPQKSVKNNFQDNKDFFVLEEKRPDQKEALTEDNLSEESALMFSSEQQGSASDTTPDKGGIKLENWFQKQFGGLFDENDTEME